MSNGPIVVAGDVVIDWMMTALPPASNLPLAAPKLYARLEIAVRGGGALLVTELLRAGARAFGQDVPILGYKPAADLENIGADQIVRTFINIERSSDNRFRVKSFGGFCGPANPIVLPFEAATRQWPRI